MRKRHMKKSCAWCGAKYNSREATVRHQEVVHRIIDWRDDVTPMYANRVNKHRQVFRCYEVRA